jgi:hypothetical protein
MRDDDGTCGPQVAEVLTENLDTSTCDQARADASLISAAPDLLGELRNIVRCFERDDPYSRCQPMSGPGVKVFIADGTITRIRHLLAKVEGRAP